MTRKKRIVYATLFILAITANIGAWWYVDYSKRWSESTEGTMHHKIALDRRVIAGNFTELEKYIISKGTHPDELRQDAFLRTAWAYANLQRYDDMHENILLAYALPVDGTNKRGGHLADTGLVVWKHGRREEAKKLWDKTFSSNPENYGSRAFLGKSLSADPRDDVRNEELGLRYAEEAYAMKPTNRSIVTVLALALAANGKYDEALEKDEEALSIEWIPTDLEKERPPFHSNERIRERMEFYKRHEPFRLKTVKLR